MQLDQYADHLQNESTGIGSILAGIAARYGQKVADNVRDAIGQVRKANIPWAAILAVLAPYIVQLLLGQKIDIQALIKALLSLIPQPAPTPTP